MKGITMERESNSIGQQTLLRVSELTDDTSLPDSESSLLTMHLRETDFDFKEESLIPLEPDTLEPVPDEVVERNSSESRDQRSIDWGQVIRAVAESDVSLVNADLEKPNAVKNGIQLSRSYWSETVSSIEFIERTEEGVAILLPSLGDIETFLRTISEKFKFHDSTPEQRFPSRGTLEERLVSPTYIADTAAAYARARTLAPGVVVLSELPAPGTFLAAEVFPIVVMVEGTSGKDKKVDSIFINESALGGVSNVCEVLSGIWSLSKAGSLKDKFQEARAPLRKPPREVSTVKVPPSPQMVVHQEAVMRSESRTSRAGSPTQGSRTQMDEAEYERILKLARESGQIL